MWKVFSWGKNNIAWLEILLLLLLNPRIKSQQSDSSIQIYEDQYSLIGVYRAHVSNVGNIEHKLAEGGLLQMFSCQVTWFVHWVFDLWSSQIFRYDSQTPSSFILKKTSKQKPSWHPVMKISSWPRWWKEMHKAPDTTEYSGSMSGNWQAN